MKQKFKIGLLSAIFIAFGFTVFAKSKKQPKNIIGINPIAITSNHAGIGFFIERFLDKNGIISVSLPLSYNWEMGTVAKSIGYVDRSPRNGFFVNPGIKFYPNGNKRFFTYSLGISFFSHSGESTLIRGNRSYDYDNNGYNGSGKGNYEFDFYSGGTLINNYLNFKIHKYLSFGFEIGIGPTFVNLYKPKDNNIQVNAGTLLYQNIAFQLAYQF